MVMRFRLAAVLMLLTVAASAQVLKLEQLKSFIVTSQKQKLTDSQMAKYLKTVKLSEKPEEMLRFDLDNENQTIRNYRERVRQCEQLGEYALAEIIRKILVQEQEHQNDLATALGVDVPDVTQPEEQA